jgi:ubiquinol-cytochrome c reductase iron-sulfur subunit
MSSTPALRDHAAASSSYESPFKGEPKTTKVPDFSKYMAKRGGSANAVFSYFMVGTLGAISAAGAKSTIQRELLWRYLGGLALFGGCDRGANSYFVGG